MDLIKDIVNKGLTNNNFSTTKANKGFYIKEIKSNPDLLENKKNFFRNNNQDSKYNYNKSPKIKSSMFTSKEKNIENSHNKYISLQQESYNLNKENNRNKTNSEKKRENMTSYMNFNNKKPCLTYFKQNKNKPISLKKDLNIDKIKMNYNQNPYFSSNETTNNINNSNLISFKYPKKPCRVTYEKTLVVKNDKENVFKVYNKNSNNGSKIVNNNFKEEENNNFNISHYVNTENNEKDKSFLYNSKINLNLEKYLQKKQIEEFNLNFKNNNNSNKEKVILPKNTYNNNAGNLNDSNKKFSSVKINSSYYNNNVQNKNSAVKSNEIKNDILVEPNNLNEKSVSLNDNLIYGIQQNPLNYPYIIKKGEFSINSVNLKSSENNTNQTSNRDRIDIKENIINNSHLISNIKESNLHLDNNNSKSTIPVNHRNIINSFSTENFIEDLKKNNTNRNHYKPRNSSYISNIAIKKNLHNFNLPNTDSNNRILSPINLNFEDSRQKSYGRNSMSHSNTPKNLNSNNLKRFSKINTQKLNSIKDILDMPTTYFPFSKKRDKFSELEKQSYKFHDYVQRELKAAKKIKERDITINSKNDLYRYLIRDFFVGKEKNNLEGSK